jgi:RNA polymerase sigma-70 factor (ECF subfamily)
MLAPDDEGDPQFVQLGQAGFALAVQLLRNRDDAADAVQDALCALLGKRNTYDARRGDMKAWFLKIVRNRCLDLLRRRVRRGVERELPEVDALTPRPDVAAEQNELSALVRRELGMLPAEQREILLLRDYHDLSYAGVAQVLSIPIGTVMSRLHRARAELQKRLQAYR